MLLGLRDRELWIGLENNGLELGVQWIGYGKEVRG